MTAKICSRGHGLYRGSSCPTCAKEPTRKKPYDPMRRIRSTASWQRCRRNVIERDHHQCTYGLYDEDDQRGLPLDETGSLPGGRRCGARRRLDAHHIIPVEQLLAEHGDPCDEDNCRTLCNDHHAAVEAARRRRERDAEEAGVREYEEPS